MSQEPAQLESAFPPPEPVSSAGMPRLVSLDTMQSAAPSKDNPIFQSGFLNPVPPVLDSGRSSRRINPPAPELPAHPIQYPVIPPPAVAPPTGHPETMGPAIEIMRVQIHSFQAANFELQKKYDAVSAKLVAVEKDKTDLIDRLEKALVIAAKLKDVDRDNTDLREKFEKSETELRRIFKENNQLNQVINDKSALLSDIREKYFAERSRNDQMASELDIVKSVSELAKKEIDVQLDRVNLREVQLSSMRNLVTSGNVISSSGNLRLSSPQSGSVPHSAARLVDDELEMAAAVYDNAIIRSGLDLKSSLREVPPNGVQLTSTKDWQMTPEAHASGNIRMSESNRRLILSGASTMTGTIYDDRVIRVSYTSTADSSSAQMEFTVTNVSPSLVSNAALLNATRQNSYFDFFFEPCAQSYIRPGEQIRVRGEFKLIGLFDSASVSPQLCVSYVQSGSVPTNKYISLPLCVLKFVAPVRPSIDQLVTKWNQFADNEVSFKFRIARDDLNSIASICVVGEMGGNLFSQRGVDPNPRGQIFAGALPAGPHGAVKEVITRLELSAPDQRGPAMLRVTLRSPLATLSKSIMTSVLDILM